MQSKVLITIPCLLTGGTEVQTLRLIEALKAGGHRCVTVCFFEHDATMTRLFEEAGSEVTILSPNGSRPSGMLRSVLFLHKGLRKAVRQYNPDIAHVQFVAPGTTAIILLRLLGIKNIIATCHTDAGHYGSLWLVHWMQRRWLRVFTCVTQAAERSFFGSSTLFNNALRLSHHNHFTIHNSLPPRWKDLAIVRKEVRTIGFVARLESIKGADMVIPAFASVRERLPGLKLLIVGDGSLRESMLKQCRQYQMDDSAIEWAGRVSYDKIADYYRRIDLLWMPSRSEGFGLSAAEAMSTGCPVVAAAVGGLTEVVSDGVDGLLFGKEDINTLADQTCRAIEEPAMLQRLSANAMANAKRFVFDIYKENIISLYSKLNRDNRP